MLISPEGIETDRQPSRQSLEQILLFGRELAAQHTQDETLKQQVAVTL